MKYIKSVPTVENSIKVGNVYQFGGDNFTNVCSVCGRLHNNNGNLCNKHQSQQDRFGFTLDTNPRTVTDSNDYIIDEANETATIILFDKDCMETERTLIDLDDLEKVRKYKWRLKPDNGYVITTLKHKDTLFLHRLVMKAGDYSDDNIIDHINHDKLDNRKSNLRLANKSTNAMNLAKAPQGYSQNYDGSYSARIKYRQKLVLLGSSFVEEEAMFMRYCAEVLLFNEPYYDLSDFNLSKEVMDSIKIDIYNKLILKFDEKHLKKDLLFTDNSLDKFLIDSSLLTPENIKLASGKLTTKDRGLTKGINSYVVAIKVDGRSHKFGTFTDINVARFARRYAEIYFWDYPLAKVEIKQIHLSKKEKEMAIKRVDDFIASKNLKRKVLYS